jgi:hypothetical protein
LKLRSIGAGSECAGTQAPLGEENACPALKPERFLGQRVFWKNGGEMDRYIKISEPLELTKLAAEVEAFEGIVRIRNLAPVSVLMSEMRIQNARAALAEIKGNKR